MLTSASIDFRNKTFSTVVARFHQGRDRITSRWGIVEERPNEH